MGYITHYCLVILFLISSTNIKANEEGFEGLIVPLQNAREAAVVDRLKIFGVENIREVIDYFSSAIPLRQTVIDTRQEFSAGKSRFDVDGDSMDDNTRDAICDRDIVLGREIKRELWKCKLHIKEWEFVIVHTEGITIKRIVEHDIETGQIKCHSFNPFYEDFDLNLEDVIELYNVIKIVDRNRKRG